MIRGTWNNITAEATRLRDQYVQAGPERCMRALAGAGTVWIGWDYPLYGLAFGVTAFGLVLCAGWIYDTLNTQS